MVCFLTIGSGMVIVAECVLFELLLMMGVRWMSVGSRLSGLRQGSFLVLVKSVEKGCGLGEVLGLPVGRVMQFE